MPYTIRASLLGFALAFAFECPVDIALLRLHTLPFEGCLAVAASLLANPLALWWTLKHNKRGFDLFKWIAALSLVWTVTGRPYLHSLGLWALALITLCVWCRVGAVVMMQRKTSKAWIDTNAPASAR
jgi:hypothetical protein